ncbi:MAG: hypothetical protein Q7W55_08885 [Pseudohongiella sp.]|nr:hypothetical protein [Pseudohongiella sp.]MDO9520731.1 hypothetical protein [Pseudohongiella sp.]MDP2126984.1 hypothetical protein [Pseudohongiella sp.]
MTRFTPGLLLLLSMVACSSGAAWQAPPARESLVPEIHADGTKFFVFQRDYLAVEAEPGFQPPGMPGSRQRSDNGLRVGEFEVEQRLTLIMQITGYCRNGFFELYREQTFRSFSVRGECREDATDADREQFQQAIALN